MEQITNEQLVAKIQAGENTAENMLQLWQQTKAYIYKVAKRYSGYAEMDDLMQEGYLGLNAAVEHYKPDQGTKFISYLTFWVKMRMQRYIENNRSVRLPSGMYQAVMRYKRFVRQYEQECGCEPSELACRAFLGVSEEELRDIRESANKANVSSLDSVVSQDNDKTALRDLIASDQNLEEDAIKKCDREMMQEELNYIIDSLPEEQRRVIREHYFERRTMKQISERMGYTKSKVDGIEKKTLRKLRTPRACWRYKEYHNQYLTPYPIMHIGINSFQRTGYSEVERAVLGW